MGKKTKDKKENSSSAREQLMSLGKLIDEKILEVKKKVKEEVQQFNEMGGFSHAGEYVAQNVTTVLSKSASALGQEEVAQKIENDRKRVLARGKEFDRKVKEEITQFNDMGGVGEYIAQNATTVLSKGALSLGFKDVAQEIENKREKIMAQGKKFDKKVSEEYQQLQDMGGVSHVGEYVAQNATTLLAKGAWAYGDDELVKKIEGKRKEIVAQGKKFDKKVQEEYQQLQNMGGFSHVGEYVAQNATTVLAKGATALGFDDTAKDIASGREKMLAAGRKFDKKVKEEVEQFKQTGGIGEYLAQNISEEYDDFKNARVNINIPKVGEFKINVSDSKSPVISFREDNPKAVLVQGCPVQSNKPKSADRAKSGVIPSSFVYKKAELSVQNLSDDMTRECSIIDGKKHGVEVIKDSQNQILDIKLYNHGNPVDLTSNKLDIRQEVGESGVVHNYCLLNDQKFGTETFADSSGKVVATFYEEGGFVMNRNEYSQIAITTVDGNKKENQTLLAVNGKKQSSR